MSTKRESASGRVHFLSVNSQGFLRTSTVTREKIAPSFFPRERNPGHGEKKDESVVVVPLQVDLVVD